jgi:hypothetical protein
VRIITFTTSCPCAAGSRSASPQRSWPAMAISKSLLPRRTSESALWGAAAERNGAVAPKRAVDPETVKRRRRERRDKARFTLG